MLASILNRLMLLLILRVCILDYAFFRFAVFIVVLCFFFGFCDYFGFCCDFFFVCFFLLGVLRYFWVGVSFFKIELLISRSG